MAIYCPFCSEPISADTSQCSACGTSYSTDTRTFLTNAIKQAEEVSPHERRKHFRFYRWHKIEYFTQEAFAESYLSDISTGGIFIQTDEPLRQGDQFNLKIFLPDGEKGLEVLCEVAWSRREWKVTPHDRIAPGMGVKFLSLSSEDTQRIMRVLNSSPVPESV